MKGKSILTFFVAVFCFVFSTSAQDNKATVNIANTKGHYVQNNKGGTVKFTLNATEAQAEQIKTRMDGHQDWKLDMKKSGNNTYDCKLQVFNATNSIGVVRIIAYMGFEEVNFNGQVKTTNDLPGALNQIR